MTSVAPHLIAWAEAPPFTEIHVSELARVHAPVYIGPGDDAIRFYASGLHVATEEQKAEIQAYEEAIQ